MLLAQVVLIGERSGRWRVQSDDGQVPSM